MVLRRFNNPENKIIHNSRNSLTLKAYAPFLFKSIRELDQVDEKAVIDSITSEDSF